MCLSDFFGGWRPSIWSKRDRRYSCILVRRDRGRRASCFTSYFFLFCPTPIRAYSQYEVTASFNTKHKLYSLRCCCTVTGGVYSLPSCVVKLRNVHKRSGSPSCSLMRYPTRNPTRVIYFLPATLCCNNPSSRGRLSTGICSCCVVTHGH